MPMPLSRLYSTVSTSPRRTVTLWPTAADTSISASLAPRRFAIASARRATSAIAPRESGSDVLGVWSSGNFVGLSSLCFTLGTRAAKRRAMEEDDFISKTRRKRHMHELQALRAALGKLSPEKLSRIDLPEAPRDAVLDAQKFTKHEARRRQLQYIGKIMRDIDADPIMEQLNALEASSRKQTAVFHVAEKWRQAL